MADADHGQDLRRAFAGVHRLDQQILEYTRANASGILALIDVLVQKGLVTPEELAESFARAQANVDEVRKAKFVGPRVNPQPEDTPPGVVDCAERMSACRAACCTTYDVHLTETEVRSGRYRWDIGHPYRLERTPEGRCVYLGAEGACGIWQDRPLVCRTHSCQDDQIIWFDFEKKLTRRAHRAEEEAAQAEAPEAPTEAR